MKIRSAVGSEAASKNNEDNFYHNGIIAEQDNPQIYTQASSDFLQFYAVCDGLGGEAYGELASLLAVTTLGKYHKLLNQIKYHDFAKYLEMFWVEANAVICQERRNNANYRMGTTIALLAVEGEILHILNVGNTRIYQIRRHKLHQLSEDHTPAERFYQMGYIKKEALKFHPHRHKLTQYLGLAPEEITIRPYRIMVKPKAKDSYLICSRGLTDVISEAIVNEIFQKNLPPSSTATELIKLAKLKGARHNITVMVVNIENKPSWFSK